MSILSDGADYVVINLFSDTEAELTNPAGFLSAVNGAVSQLKELTGYLPGYNYKRLNNADRLIIQEVDESDPELSNKQFAIWSPSTGKIKLNRLYKNKFIAAVNTSPMVFEFIEALGTAATAFQVQNPTQSLSTVKQIIGKNNLGLGFSRAVGLYPYRNLLQVSSIWNTRRYFTIGELLTNDLIRCYRKRRLNYTGNQILENQVSDADISYGMFVELFTGFSDWNSVKTFIRYWLTNTIKNEYTNNIFEKSDLAIYDMLILNLADTLRLNISSLLVTWGFTRTDILYGLPENLEIPDSSQAITISSKFASSVSLQNLEREFFGANNFIIALGGSDSFGISQSIGSVMVLESTPPQDNKTFSGLNAKLLGVNEANGINRTFELNTNLGESKSPVITLLIPDINPLTWDLQTYVSLIPASGQTLKIGRLVNLGEATQEYKVTVSRWEGTDPNNLTEVKYPTVIPVETYVVFAQEGENYNYIYHNGNYAAQIITKETIPVDKFLNPETEELVNLPNGTIDIVRSCISTTEFSGFTTKEFYEVSVVKNSQGVVQGSFRNSVTPTVDPDIRLLRERPASEQRVRRNVLSSVGQPVLSEKVGFGTRLIASSLAVNSELAKTKNGQQTEKDQIEQYRAQLPINPIQIINLPDSFAKELTAIINSSGNGTTDEQRRMSKLEQVLILLDGAPEDLKQRLRAVSFKEPIYVPQVQNLSLILPLGVGEDKKNNQVVKVGEFLATAILTSSSDTALERADKSFGKVVGWSENIQNSVTKKSDAIAVIEATKDSPQTQISNFLRDGFAGAMRTNGDPHNPATALDGAWLNNVYGLFEHTKGSLIPVLNPGANPRAVGQLIGGLTESAAVAAGLPPGVASGIEQAVQNTLTAVVQADKPPMTPTLIKSAEYITRGIINTHFPGEESRVYNTVLGYVSSRLIDWASGNTEKPANKPESVITAAATNTIAVDTSKLNTQASNSGTSPSQPNSPFSYIPLTLGLTANTNTSTAEISGLLATKDGNYVPLFTYDGTPTITVSSYTQQDYSAMFSSDLSNVVLNFTKVSPEQASELDSLKQTLAKADKARLASISRIQAALLEQHYYDSARQIFNEKVAANNLQDALKEAKNKLSGISYWDKNGLKTLSNNTSASQLINTRFSVTNLEKAIQEYKKNKANISSSAVSYNGYPIALFRVYEELEARVELLKKREVRDNVRAAGSAARDAVPDTSLRLSTPEVQKLVSIARIKEVSNSSNAYTFEVMPAIRSFAQTQGMQAPGADHGISWKSNLNIAKLNVPGSTPIYQVMGIGEETIEFSGAFLGMRSAADMKNANSGSSQLEVTSSEYYRAQHESEQVKKLQTSGTLLELEITSYSGTKPTGDIPDHGISIKVNGYIHQLHRHVKGDDRIWYQIVFRVTDKMVLGSSASNGASTRNNANTTSQNNSQIQSAGVQQSAEAAVATPRLPAAIRANPILNPQPFFPLIEAPKNPTVLAAPTANNTGAANSGANNTAATSGANNTETNRPPVQAVRPTEPAVKVADLPANPQAATYTQINALLTGLVGNNSSLINKINNEFFIARNNDSTRDILLSHINESPTIEGRLNMWLSPIDILRQAIIQSPLSRDIQANAQKSAQESTSPVEQLQIQENKRILQEKKLRDYIGDLVTPPNSSIPK